MFQLVVYDAWCCFDRSAAAAQGLNDYCRTSRYTLPTVLVVLYMVVIDKYMIMTFIKCATRQEVNDCCG